MRNAAAYIGIAALVVSTLIWLEGTGGVSPVTNHGVTRWVVFSVLVGIIVFWVAALVWDFLRNRPHPDAHQLAAAEAAATTFADDDDLAAIDRRSRLAHLRLSRLADLRGHGAITDEEFQAKKARILDEI